MMFKRILKANLTQKKPISANSGNGSPFEKQHVSVLRNAEFLNVCIRARSRPWGKEILAQQRHVYPRRR